MTEKNNISSISRTFITYASMLILLFISGGCHANNSATEKSWYINPENYQEQLAQVKSQDSIALKKHMHLLEQANIQLDKGPYSVMNKTADPPSGDKHDYLSLAPYFWPNPDTGDGLPYIRKDGEVNPETRDAFTDYEEKSRCFNAIGVLGKAAYFSGDTVYINKVIHLINVWFLDKGTRMNPNLNYGQGIPGINDGRPFGIIEFGGIKSVLTTLELLRLQGTLPPQTEDGMQTWLLEYVHWLETSELGILEKTRSNNHGTHYDGQLCAILFYLGETVKIKAHLETVTKPRIAQQIETDGKQLHELARTKAFSYSTMNLSGLITLARYGKRVDVDLWNYESEDGRSIKRAFDFLIQYISTDKEWDYQQIKKLSSSKDRFARLVLDVGREFDEAEYVKIADDYFRNKIQKETDFTDAH